MDTAPTVQTTDPLGSLPPELILNVLVYLPLPALRSMHLTCRRWHQFVLENESYIYHNAAATHNFIASTDVTLADAKAAHGDHFLDDADNWRSFCRNYFQLEKNWAGRGEATIRPHHAPICLPWQSYGVHRIKVDERNGFIITTHRNAGLTVSDIKTDRVLWSLPQWYVRPHAHIEYQNGYLIFDRLTGEREVWRLKSEYEPEKAPLVARCDARQEAADMFASSIVHPSDLRGHFKPWALFANEDDTSASRFVYPTYLLAGRSRAYLYDVTTGHQVQIIENIFDADDLLENVNYVDLSDKHVYICGRTGLRIFDRANGRVCFFIPSELPIATRTIAPDVSAPTRTNHPLAVLGTRKELPGAGPPFSQFIAAHVSSCDRNLAILRSDNRLLLIRDLESLIREHTYKPEMAIEVDFGAPQDVDGFSPSVYLAFEHGKVSLVTTSGLFVFTLDHAFHCLSDVDLLHPVQQAGPAAAESGNSRSIYSPLIACRVLPFANDRALLRVSCLQMTESKVYLSWDQRFLEKPAPEGAGNVPGATPTETHGPTHGWEIAVIGHAGHADIAAALDAEAEEFEGVNDDDDEPEPDLFLGNALDAVFFTPTVVSVDFSPKPAL